MALIACPECGKEISNQAPACIHCGCPLAPRAPLDPNRFSVVLTACPEDSEGRYRVRKLAIHLEESVWEACLLYTSLTVPFHAILPSKSFGRRVYRPPPLTLYLTRPADFQGHTLLSHTRAAGDGQALLLRDGETIGFSEEQRLPITRNAGVGQEGMTLKIGWPGEV